MNQFSAMNAFVTTPVILGSSDYIFEPKLDGFRALCFKDKNGTITFISRNNLDLTEKFFSDVDFKDTIYAKTCVLDGEIVAYDSSGKPNFSLLKNGSQAHYVVFDILMKDGKSLVDTPLLKRKAILEETVSPSQWLQIIPYTTNGNLLWKEMVALKLEGVMAKEKESLYYPGKRSPVWLKVKLANTVDCIIIGYTSHRRTIAALALGLYNKQGELVHIGNVGTGFSQKTLQELEARLIPLATDKSQVKTEIKNIHWVQPEIVCEIKYQEITPYQKLRMPVFIRIRDDKKPVECTVAEQLESIK